MKPATNPHADCKTLVRKGYDACADAYAQARDGGPTTALDLLTAQLTQGAKVLDLGCGPGVPVARALAERYEVTGVDFSSRQIQLARQRVPSATFIEADIATLELPLESFNAVVAFYAIFHLPRDEQRQLFRSIWRWLRPGGYLMATVSDYNEDPYTEDDFFGVTMYWTNFALHEYQAFLREIGFDLLDPGPRPGSWGLQSEEPQEYHPLVFARKPAEPEA